MPDLTAYEAKLADLERQTLLPRLEPEVGDFVRELARRYRFTFQELRIVAQAARDLEMWRERPLADWWAEAEQGTRLQGRERKKALLAGLRRRLDDLSQSAKAYPEEGLAAPARRQVRLVDSDSDASVFGRCAAHSERTVCCGLHTIDAVRGCPFDCSYCTIQTFYGEEAELEVDLAEKLAGLELDADRFYHIGTGQSSDSLVWGNRGGALEALLEFAARHPNVLLEMKTKSDNVRYLLERPLPPNVVCSWSLNTDVVIENEEKGTASLARRLAAARAVADRGTRVAFHFHPMVYYQGWSDEYPAIAESLVADFDSAEVAFLSMGSVTLIRPVLQEIRRRGGETKILQMDLVPDPHGKLTYADERKIEMYRSVYRALAPWHDEVFFYLCMETAAVWLPVLGHAYATNDLFEADFARRCHSWPAQLLETRPMNRPAAIGSTASAARTPPIMAPTTPAEETSLPAK